jgi:Putative prokaryotic signal transducing protein
MPDDHDLPALHDRIRIAVCRDSAEAALVRAVLSGHDIAVYVSGDHSNLLGLGAAAISRDCWVPRADADEARALIQELREGGPAALADGEIPVDDTAEREDEVSPGGALVTSGDDTLARLGKRNRIVLAVMVGMTLGHGTAHMSARAWKRGITLAAIEIVGWRHLAHGNTAIAGALVLGAIVVDLAGAVVTIMRTAATIPSARVTRGA